MIQLLLVSLIRAVGKNDFTIIGTDIEQQLKKIRAYIPAISEFEGYIIKKRDRQKSVKRTSPVAETSKEKINV